MSTKALELHLAPLIPFLQINGVTEICINEPKEVFIEQEGRFYCHSVPALEFNLLETLAALIAEFNNMKFPSPLVSGSLPTGERIQFVMPPGCEKDKVICSIRRQQKREIQLEDYENSGAFLGVKNNKNHSTDEALKILYREKAIYQFIKLAIQSKKNILICGGTGTGKTTFLNACLKLISNEERLISMEDTREVKMDQPNKVHLIFNEDDPVLSASSLFRASLRLRPDRIFLSELRGKEVWPYLRAANSGHPGSITTVHADTPKAAFQQLVFMMQQAGTTSDEEQILNYIKSIIHVVIQLKRDPDPTKFVSVSEVYFDSDN